SIRLAPDLKETQNLRSMGARSCLRSRQALASAVLFSILSAFYRPRFCPKIRESLFPPPQAVTNLEVAGRSSYLVGSGVVLVHNASGFEGQHTPVATARFAEIWGGPPVAGVTGTFPFGEANPDLIVLHGGVEILHQLPPPLGGYVWIGGAIVFSKGDSSWVLL